MIRHRHSGRNALTGLVALSLVAMSGDAVVAADGTEATDDGSAAADDGELISVRIAAILGAGQGIFSTVMVESGIDHELGLDVEIVPISTTGQQWLAIRDGSADVAAGSVLDLLRNRASGLEATAVNAFQTYVNPVLVTADSPVETLADLEGQRIGTPSDTLLDFMILRAAGERVHGIDVGVDATPVPAAPNLLNKLLEDGEIDAALQFESLATGPVADGTLREIVRIPDLMEEAAFSRDAFYTLFNVSDDWIEEHPDDVGTLAEAFTRTFELLQEDDAAWEPLLEEVGITDEMAAEAFIEAQRAITGPPYTSDLLEPTEELINALIEVAGADDVGVPDFDSEAFLFPNE